MHAETALLRKLKPAELKGAKIYVYRFNNTTASDAREPKCSMPCPMCQHVLRRAGIGRVFCMNDKNKITILKRNDMIVLQDDPTILTAHFMRKCGRDRHGKFKINDYRLRYEN